jgi:hypothetical protein
MEAALNVRLELVLPTLSPCKIVGMALVERAVQVVVLTAEFLAPFLVFANE